LWETLPQIDHRRPSKWLAFLPLLQKWLALLPLSQKWLALLPLLQKWLGVPTAVAKLFVDY
jgi:hypothetical protein